MSLAAIQQYEAMERAKARAINEAAKALGVLTIEGMTQLRWSQLTASERESIVDNSGLTPQLIQFENCRVEVVDQEGDKPRRFRVGKSTGWRPCHIEIPRWDSSGGVSASMKYHSVKVIKGSCR